MRAAGQVSAARSLSGELLPARFPVLAAALGAGLVGGEQRDLIVRALTPGVERGDPLVVAEAERCLVAAAVGGDALANHRELVEHLLAGAGADGARADGRAEAARVEALLEVAPRGVREDADADAGVFAPAAPLRDLMVMANAWGLVLDPDGPEPGEQQALIRRGITLGRARDGLVPLRGHLLPEVAALLSRQFDACLNPRLDITEASTPGDPTVVDGDDRSRPQRRHDALMMILGAAAAAPGMPTVQRAAPVLVVTATVDQLGDPDGVAFIQGTHEDTDPAVPIRAAWHAGCAGGVQKVLLDSRGAILGTSSVERVFTAAQRRAITARDGTCVIPGCRTPATWCEIHHVVEYQEGGPTDTGNGAALCWFHHRFLHVHGWQIRMRDGLPQVKAPPWIGPGGVWQQGGTSLHRAHDQVRRQAGERRGSQAGKLGRAAPPDTASRDRAG